MIHRTRLAPLLLSFAALTWVAGVSHALPIGKTLRIDVFFDGNLVDAEWVRVDEFGDCGWTTQEGTSLALSVDDSLGYDVWTATVGATSWVTPWDGVGELITIDPGDGTTIRVKTDNDYAQNERELELWNVQRLLAYGIGGGMYCLFIAGVRRLGWDF